MVSVSPPRFAARVATRIGSAPPRTSRPIAAGTVSEVATEAPTVSRCAARTSSVTGPAGSVQGRADHACHEAGAGHRDVRVVRHDRRLHPGVHEGVPVTARAHDAHSCDPRRRAVRLPACARGAVVGAAPQLADRPRGGRPEEVALARADPLYSAAIGMRVRRARTCGPPRSTSGRPRATCPDFPRSGCCAPWDRPRGGTTWPGPRSRTSWQFGARRGRSWTPIPTSGPAFTCRAMRDDSAGPVRRALARKVPSRIRSGPVQLSPRR